MTKEAIKLSGKTSSTNPDDAAAEDNAESPSVFSVKELAEFGQSDLVPAADQTVSTSLDDFSKAH